MLGIRRGSVIVLSHPVWIIFLLLLFFHALCPVCTLTDQADPSNEDSSNTSNVPVESSSLPSRLTGDSNSAKEIPDENNIQNPLTASSSSSSSSYSPLPTPLKRTDDISTETTAHEELEQVDLAKKEQQAEKQEADKQRERKDGNGSMKTLEQVEEKKMNIDHPESELSAARSDSHKPIPDPSTHPHVLTVSDDAKKERLETETSTVEDSDKVESKTSNTETDKQESSETAPSTITPQTTPTVIDTVSNEDVSPPPPPASDNVVSIDTTGQTHPGKQDASEGQTPSSLVGQTTEGQVADKQVSSKVEPSAELAPSDGQAFPAERQVLPPGGQVPSPGGMVPPPGGQISPPAGEVSPSGGQIPPSGGEVPPPGGEVPPPGGEVPPPGGEVPPPGGEVSPPAGQVPKPAGQVLPSAGQSAGQGSDEQTTADERAPPSLPAEPASPPDSEKSVESNAQENTSVEVEKSPSPLNDSGVTVDMKEKEKSSSDQEGEADDIVTFEEFKAKMRETAPVKPLLQERAVAPPISKSNNNYASSECGAKVVASNPEAKNTGAILMENRDLYMLNPCSARIWFIVELCEAVTVNSVEMASFELFSSVPEDLALYTSDRYPVQSWEKVPGRFHMRNERTVHTFPVDVSTYVKYIKVEMLSHFGSEHFCPLSMLRVFGTTMMEDYEYSESQRDQQQTDGEPRGGGGGERGRGGGGGGGADGDDETPTIPVNPEASLNDGPQERDKDNPIFAATGALWSVIGKAVNGLMAQDADGRRVLDGSHLPSAGQPPARDPAGSAPESVRNSVSSGESDNQPQLTESQTGIRDSPDTAHVSVSDGKQTVASGTPGNFVHTEDLVDKSKETIFNESASLLASNASNSSIEKNDKPEGADLGSSSISQELTVETFETITTSTVTAEVHLPPTPHPSPATPPNSEKHKLTNPPTLRPPEQNPPPQPDKHASIDTGASTHGRPDPIVTEPPSLGESETKTTVATDEPPLSPPSTSDNLFQETLPETHQEKEQRLGGEETGVFTSKSHGNERGSSDEVQASETKIASHGFEFPSENGDLRKPDMFSQGPTVGVVTDNTASESTGPVEDKQTSLINNTTGQANVSCNGDLGAQRTHAHDLNGNSSKNEREESVGLVNNPPSPGAEEMADSTQAAEESTSGKQQALLIKEHPDQGTSLQDQGGGLTSGVVTGVGGGGGSTAGDVTAGMSSGGEGGGQTLVSSDRGGGSGVGGMGGSTAGLGNGVTGGNGLGGATGREKSVFVKLSNRINMLEGNISLFTSYLDQISNSLKRNKNKTEDMQKGLERRMLALNETVYYLQKQMNESLMTDMFSSLVNIHDTLSGVQKSINDIIELGLLSVLVPVALDMFILFFILICCVALCRQSTRYQHTQQKAIASLQQEINDLNQLLTQQQKNYHLSSKNTNTVTPNSAVPMLNGSTAHYPLTLSSLNSVQDCFTTTAERETAEEPDTAMTALVAAMASKPRLPTTQQKPKPQEKWQKVDYHQRKHKTKQTK